MHKECFRNFQTYISRLVCNTINIIYTSFCGQIIFFIKIDYEQPNKKNSCGIPSYLL